MLAQSDSVAWRGVAALMATHGPSRRSGNGLATFSATIFFAILCLLKSQPNPPPCVTTALRHYTWPDQFSKADYERAAWTRTDGQMMRDRQTHITTTSSTSSIHAASMQPAAAASAVAVPHHSLPAPRLPVCAGRRHDHY